MRLLITLLGAICILPLAAFALECIQCIGKNSDSCVGPSVVCKNAKECMVISEYYYFEQNTCHTVKKDCNELYPCGKTLYATNQFDIGFRIHIECCKGDDCNTFNYNMPPENIELKGKYCPSCFGSGLKECKKKRMIRCENEKDKCHNYIGKLGDPAGNEMEMSVKSCSSAESCVLGFDFLIGFTEFLTVFFNCSESVENF
ncbi:uncharacterized protein LOC142662295 [Rhinoderma darwinii]|uniref:uncharacterized protein LOC142662295 n=1 Tax=Rhinoderma darwinii TaxID=43563 RepID=UPI003F674CA2